MNENKFLTKICNWICFNRFTIWNSHWIPRTISKISFGFDIEPWSERRDVSRHNLGIFISVDEPSLNTKVIIIIEISTEQWWKKKLRTVYSMLILLNHLLQSVEYFWYPSKAIKTFQNTSLFYMCLHCLYY